MIRLVVETALGETITIRARQYGEAFGRADEIAGVCATDGYGERYINFFGHWVRCPEAGDQP